MKLVLFVEKNTVGGSADDTFDDTFDLSVTFWYQSYGSAAVRTQVVEVATTCDDDAQFTAYKVVVPVNWDETDNVVLSDDVFAMRLNLETDTSECDDIIITHGIFLYQTKTPAYEIP